VSTCALIVHRYTWAPHTDKANTYFNPRTSVQIRGQKPLRPGELYGEKLLRKND